MWSNAFTRESKHKKQMAILHWPEKSVPKLGPWRDIFMGMSVLCKAIEFLGRTIFSNQILFSSGSGAKDKKGWNSRKFDGWSSGQVLWQILGDYSIEAHWKSLCSLNIQEHLTQIFTGSSCYSLGLIMIPNTWIKKAGILPSQKMYHREGTFSPCSCFSPSSRPLFLVTGYGDCGGDRVEFSQLFLSNLNLRLALCTFALYLWGLGL